MSILGTRVVRTEDPLFLTRGATYTDDLADERLAGALHATFVRSTVAHGRLLSVDASAALAAPGVVAVVTADDVDELRPIPPPFPFINPAMTRPWLASDRVRFVGDPIAVVLTEERYQGEDAAEMVAVDIDPLPAVVGTAAAAADEVLLFPEAGTNVMAAFGERAPADLFDGCEVVVSRPLVNQRVAPVPLEGRAAAAAVWSEDGRLTAWCTNQGAQQARGQFGDWLEMDPDLIRLITPDVGGGFGAKIGADPEYALVAWLAKHVGRPVRWAESRSENLVGMLHGRAQDQVVTIGGRRDGTIEAYSLVADQDCGAYPRIGAVLPTLTMLMAAGVYGFPRVHAQARALATTTTPIGAYRGAGRPEATAALERAVDLFAAEIGMDPADVRRRNLLPAFREPHTTPMGATYDTGDYTTALDRALEAAGYEELRAEQARRRERGDVRQLGIGMSVYVEITGADNGAGTGEAASLEVHPDGTATVLTGTSPHGQGHATAWAMIASDQLGIPMERITVVHGDTDLVQQGGGTMGSRSLQQGGAAVHQAAGELIELAKERAAERLEVAPEDLVVDLGMAGLAVRGTPGTGIPFAELAGDERLLVHTRFDAAAPTFPFGAHVVVAEVDVESGKAEVTRFVAVDDAGTILNPLLAEGQRHGGYAQGVAQALMEEVLYDEDGNPTTATLADYPFVSATELPSFELVEMATPTPMNALGAKGIGEAGTIGATPAVQNAVIDAVAHLGVRHIDMPTTPMRVFRTIQQARGGS